MFSPVGASTEKLSERLVEQIKQQIVLGEVKPGDKLPSENELCELFQVSRTTVREAILSLVALGVVRVHHGKGIFVEQFSLDHFLQKAYPIILSTPGDYEDVIYTRRLIESECARLAALHATEEDIEKMGRLIHISSRLRPDNENDLERLKEINSQFHRIIASSCNSKVLLHIIQPLWHIIDKTRQMSLTTSGRRIGAVREHANILDAIRTRDAQRAYDEMNKHLQGVRIGDQKNG